MWQWLISKTLQCHKPILLELTLAQIVNKYQKQTKSGMKTIIKKNLTDLTTMLYHPWFHTHSREGFCLNSIRWCKAVMIKNQDCMLKAYNYLDTNISILHLICTDGTDQR